MAPHPIHKSGLREATGIGVVGLMVAVLWGLLRYYCALDSTAALVDSLGFFLVLGSAGYAYWIIFGYLKTLILKATAAVLALGVGMAESYILLTGFQLLPPAEFYAGIPLHLLTGTVAWLILYLWYSHEHNVREPEGEEQKKPIPVTPAGVPEQEVPGRSTRISVKNGTQITVLDVSELLYIQADGDYVWLHTADGKFMKEETMKKLEECLPEPFVRIHRSTIINSNHISRVELMGKESYHVRLSNGAVLRASVNGYKLLKVRLSL